MRLIPRRLNRQVLTLALLWGAWIALYLFGYQGQLRQFKQVLTSLAPLNKQMEVYAEMLSWLPDPQKGLAQLEERRGRLKEQTLSPQTAPRAIQQLAQVAAANGITLEAINPRDDPRLLSSAVLPKGVGKRLIEVRLRCPYQALGDFISRLEGLPTPFTVDRLWMYLVPDSGEVVQVNLLVSTYGLT
ncbi:MAG: hypothetical protein HYZ93_04990 [Candidatus Omnitrophica bacterium]|nr:hypothetical protein [Candidatus Omnitrophota bacterium]